MQAISVDLPWGVSGEAAVAIVDQGGRTSWHVYQYPKELVRFLARQGDALTLLDIPMYGVDRLGREHFRPIDKALQSLRINLMPSSKAGERGKQLMYSVWKEAGVASEQFWEIYPYAVYKVLDYLDGIDRLKVLQNSTRSQLLGPQFKKHFPVKYKRVSGERRMTGLRALHRLLMHPDLGITFPDGLPSPDGERPALKLLTDVYDACIGAVLGLRLLRKSPWAVQRGDEEHGNMVLLADEWLSAQIYQQLAMEAVS